MTTLLSDGFEDQTWDAWTDITGTVPTISGTAALTGSYGVELDYITDGNGYYNYTNETHQTYRLEFEIDVNDLTGDGGDNIRVADISDRPTVVGYVQIIYVAVLANWSIRVAMRDDGGTFYTSSDNEISAGKHTIEVEWVFADTVGTCKVWIDGTPGEGVSNIDSDTRFPDQVRFGHVASNPDPNSGTGYLDEFYYYDTVRPGDNYDVSPSDNITIGEVAGVGPLLLEIDVDA